MIDQDRAQRAVRELLSSLGQDPDSEGLKGTPDRVARMFAEVLSGYDEDESCLDTQFDSGESGIVVLNGISFVSWCEHHLMPFSGAASVAYLPVGGRVVGLSKLARIVDVYAGRLQLQERLTQQVAEAVRRRLNPGGVGVVLRASHGCMTCRGVSKPDAVMVTSVMLGVFRENTAARAEVLSLMGVG